MVSSVGPFLRSSFTMGFWVGLDVDFSFFFGKLLVFGFSQLHCMLACCCIFFRRGGVRGLRLFIYFFIFDLLYFAKVVVLR